MKKIVFYSAIIIWCAASLSAQTIYYRSDWVGLELEPISRYRRDEFDYVLAFSNEPSRTVKILYHKQKEWKRWETLFNERREIIQESEWENKILVGESFFEKKGRLKSEHRFERGVMVERRVYSYSARGVDFVEAFDGAGNPLYTDEYEIAPSGRLRSMRRVYPDNSFSLIHYIYGEGLLVGEWEYHDGRVFDTKFNDRGQARYREEWEGDTLLLVREYSYDEKTGKLIKETENNLAAQSTTERHYDKEGNMERESTRGADQRTEEITYTYDGDKKTGMRKKSPIGVEEWKYFYNASGTLEKEEYYKRGFLALRTVYTDGDSWYEEILREEQVIIRVFFFKERKIREEFIQDGQVIRSKDY